MSQVLHIFRKDVRHFWIEISASLAILVAYTLQTIADWGEPEPTIGFLGILQKTLMVLVPVSWCFLVIRSIQDESLVGDRQFWITRPYDWKKLAAAKLLLAVVFVNVPLFIVQAILLNHAGFPAVHYVKGLLWMQLLILLVAVLPAAVTAVATSSIVQVLIGIVCVGLYGFGLASLDSVMPSSDIPTSTQSSDYWSAGIVSALALLLILAQFRWRRPWVLRFVIVGAALVGVLMEVTSPFLPGVSNAYPLLAAGAEAPIRIDVLARITTRPKGEEAEGSEKKVNIIFPTQVSDVAHGTVARVVGTQVTIQAPNGAHWSSKWQPTYWEYWPGDYDSSMPVEIDRKFFDRNRDAPVNIHFSFAVTGYRETNIREITAQAAEFPIAGIGRCWVGFGGYRGTDQMACLAPLKEPSLSARVDSSASTCTPGPGEDASLHQSLYSWNLEDDSDPADPGINPVKYFTFYFSSRETAEGKSPLGVCPGTPITLSRPEPFQDVRIEAELDGVKLSDYLVPPFRFQFR
jgi:hypothetical protein